MKIFSNKPSPTPAKTEEAFLHMLYEKYAGYLMHLAFSILHDRQSAEDMVAEMFLHLIKNILQIQQYSCSQLNHYLVISIRGRCFNLLAKQKKQREHEKDLFDQAGEMLKLPSDEPPVDEQVLRKMDMETAARLLEEVSPAYRDAFKLKYQLGLGDTEIAQAIGIQPQSVKVYVRRAQNELRKLANERGMVHE